MKIFCIGDIVGRYGRGMIRGYLDDIIYQKNIDFVVVNAENASHGNGMNRNAFEELSARNIDAFTMGNHTWGAKGIVEILEREPNVIRPANYDESCPGKGYTVIKKNGISVGVVNLIGQTFLPPCDSPFRTVDRILEELDTTVTIVDFHAEATSEKVAMGWYLDGRVSAVFGTHTHVQTADETILPKGTAYITDLGMTGSANSVLGRDKESIISKFLNGMPQKLALGVGMNRLCGCIFEIDEATGKAVGIERIMIKE